MARKKIIIARVCWRDMVGTADGDPIALIWRVVGVDVVGRGWRDPQAILLATGPPPMALEVRTRGGVIDVLRELTDRLLRG